MGSNSLNRYKILIILFITFLVVLLQVTPVVAVTIGVSGLEDEEQVGEEIDLAFNVRDLADGPETWLLTGETELSDPEWRVLEYDSGEVQSETVIENDSLTYEVDRDRDVHRIVVELRGTVPPIENYSYDPAEQVEVANFTQTNDTISQENWVYSLRPYTEESEASRQALRSAELTILSAESFHADTSESIQLFQLATDAYASEDFETAISLAEQAEEQARQERAEQTAWNRTRDGAILGVLLFGIGLFWYWRRKK